MSGDEQPVSNAERGFASGGLGGRPSLDTGEPVLARWFVLLLLVMVPLGLVISVWAALSFSREEVTAAARRPPGSIEVTHERGRAVLAETDEREPGPSCAAGVTLVGDEGGRATGRRALTVLCDLVASQVVSDQVTEGLRQWQLADGILRVAAFELTGVDAATRVEGGSVVIELNAKFQFDDAAEALPMLVHELVHLHAGWPLAPVDAAQELAAMTAQAEFCGMVPFRGAPPRGCLDADELLAADDPLQELRDAGYA